MTSGSIGSEADEERGLLRVGEDAEFGEACRYSGLGIRRNHISRVGGPAVEVFGKLELRENRVAW